MGVDGMKRKGLGFYLRIYGKILAQDIKSKMSYRADFIISTVGMICTNIAGFISFWILFRNFPSVSGWGYYEMLFLYGFSLVSLTPVQCFFDNNWSLRSTSIPAISSNTASARSICSSTTSRRCLTSRDSDSLPSASARWSMHG